MNETSLSSRLARKIVLNAQLLNGRKGLFKGKKGIVQTIDKLGYIQIDTISIIKRSHHHTLWTRVQNYKKEKLHELQAKDRAIFEYWGHAMSYFLMTDYRFFLRRMQNFKNPSSKWALYHKEKCDHLFEPILERIRNEGPLSSKDFAATGKKGGTWWDWKPAKVALELLFWRGDLMITERQKFQKIYDLTERVIPEDLNTTMPDSDELGQFLVRRALTSFGLATSKEIQKYIQPESARDSDLQVANKEVLEKTINNLVNAKEVLPVNIEQKQNTTYYTLSDVLENSNLFKKETSFVFLLSPFDNLVIQRKRLKQLFGFQYSLECYVPEAKRKYGYFVLPVLWGENFVGRLDPKADRKNKTFIINNLVFEPNFTTFEKFLPLFASKLCELAKFNNCENILFRKISPGKIKTTLKSLVKKALP